VTETRVTEVGDICYYSDGSEYVVTDHGPNVWAQCWQCSSEAAGLPTMRTMDVLCGPCMLRKYGLWPGQQIFEAKIHYANELGVRAKGHQARSIQSSPMVAAAAVRERPGWPMCSAGCGWPIDTAALAGGFITHPLCQA
jgi:hypothetical protein